MSGARARRRPGVSTGLERTPLVLKAAYGLGVFGTTLAQLSFALLLLFFYTDVMRLSPIQAGLVISLGSTIDIGANFGIAWLSARRKGGGERYRPFILYAAPLLGLTLFAMFYMPSIAPEYLFAYALVTHLAFRASYAAVMTPHSSLISRLSDDADERAAIGGVKAIANALGVLTGAVLGIEAIENLPPENLREGFVVFALVFGALAGASAFLSGWVCRERVNRQSMDRDVSNPLLAAKAIGRNPKILVLFAAMLVFFVGYTILNSGLVYLFRYVVDADFSTADALIAISVGGVLMPSIWTMIIRRTSKAAVWTAGCTLVALVLGLQYLISSSAATWLMIIAYVLVGAGKSGIVINYFALTADAVDYGQWRVGERVEAFSFALLAIMNKTGTALGAALLGFLLEWSGYVPGVAQTAGAKDSISWIACLVPAGFMLVSGLIMLAFRLDAKRHRAILEEMK